MSRNSEGLLLRRRKAREIRSLGGGPAAELVDVTASECADLRKRVLPGQPSQGYIIDERMNVALCSGTRMPELGVLPRGQITTIAGWICEGAPND